MMVMIAPRVPTGGARPLVLSVVCKSTFTFELNSEMCLIILHSYALYLRHIDRTSMFSRSVLSNGDVSLAPVIGSVSCVASQRSIGSLS